MIELFKTHTIYLSTGIKACAVLIVALAAIQAIFQACGFFSSAARAGGKKPPLSLRYE